YIFNYTRNMTNVLPGIYSMHISYLGTSNASLLPYFSLDIGNNTSYIPQVTYNGTVSNSGYSLGPAGEDFINMTINGLSPEDLQFSDIDVDLMFLMTFFNGPVYISYYGVMNLNMTVYYIH
ncbi:MAG: hypothetical protein ACP5UV_04630, partial [Thermoplasmata archaeon]